MPPSAITTVRAGPIELPRFGVGTWRMGEVKSERANEARSLAHVLERGVTLIDTAEMYGEGGAEEVIAGVIRGRRDGLTLVSKVYPHNASASGVIAACERSLKRLGTDRIDLYLLHWRGRVPLAETVEGFERLRTMSKIRAWGVSNFDRDDMVELSRTAGGAHCAADQVLYHLGERGIEFDLAPALTAARIPLMAYSPLGQGPLLRHPALKPIAAKHGVTPAAIALAFVLRDPNVVAIPKSSSTAHFDENLKALDVTLDADDMAALDRAFPPPRKKSSLAMT
jgi:diketogulonate reductase-like aldo/keto reductase